MNSELRLMCVLAHPDDESLGTGGALAACAAEGIATYLVTATRGERGRFGDGVESPGTYEIVGRTREAELLRRRPPSSASRTSASSRLSRTPVSDAPSIRWPRSARSPDISAGSNRTW